MVSNSSTSKKKKKGNNRKLVLFRYFIIICFMMIFSIAIIWKLFSTTIIHAADWNEKAASLTASSKVIPPERGDILSCDGNVLATNLMEHQIHIDFGCEGFKKKAFMENINALSDSLGKYYPKRTADEWRVELLAQLDKKSHYYLLLKDLSITDVERVQSFPFFNINNRYHTGFIHEFSPERVYPYGAMARRSIGQIGRTAENDTLRGISGLEFSLNSRLCGEPGLTRPVFMTRKVGQWTDKPAVPGYDVTTTLDITLQDMLERELNDMLVETQAEWSTAILMEVSTGDIKAIANLEKDPKTGNYIEAFNRAVIAYEPGSVIKVVSMMFALENNYCPPLDELIEIKKPYIYAGRNVPDCNKKGMFTPGMIIAKSSNIGIVKITTRHFDSNPKGFADLFETVGFFEPIDCGIYCEMPIIMRNPTRLDMSRMCFGYSTAIPPMYTLAFFNAIANKGKMVRPRLVKKLTRNGVDSIIPVTYIRDRICSEKNAAILTDMLSLVVEKGTAIYLKNDYVKIAGKTGTVNYYNGQRYVDGVNRLAFCGFFPADNPQYSCMVLTFHPEGKFGAPKTSGRVLKNMALNMYARGMLNNTSDYNNDVIANPEKEIVIASTTDNSQRSSLVKEIGSATKVSQIRSNIDYSAVCDTVAPSVINLGLRDAVSVLEAAGFEVDFDGDGRVVEQRLNPATRRVYLTLRRS